MSPAETFESNPNFNLPKCRWANLESFFAEKTCRESAAKRRHKMCRLGLIHGNIPDGKTPLRANRIHARWNCRPLCGSSTTELARPFRSLNWTEWKSETHLHVESARALGDGAEGRVGLEGGGGADDQAGDGELHDCSCWFGVGYDKEGRKVRKIE